MSRASLFAESTSVEALKSVSEIQALLVQAGARGIHTEYDGDGKIIGLSFSLVYGNGQLTYKLPARTISVYQKVLKRQQFHGSKTIEQAERIAWRQLYWWVKAQLAMIDIGMVEAAEVLMPYMLGSNGQTFFDTYKGKMLAGPATSTDNQSSPAGTEGK